MRRMPAVPTLVVAVLLAGTTACSDSSGPGAATPPTLPGLVVSAPVPSGAVQGSVEASAALSVSAGVTYVSLAPGSVPDGRLATIRNRATTQFVMAEVLNGGFDPVAIVATVGDTLAIEITRTGAVAPLTTVAVVRAARPPVVVRTDPPKKQVDVPLNATIVIVFSAPIDATTLTTGSVQLWRGTTPVGGTVRFADAAHLRAEFHADSLLAPQTEYQLVVTQGILDLNGLALDSTVAVPFTTGTTAPATGLVFASVSVGYLHACGVTTTGAAYCWGDNTGGTLGDGKPYVSSGTPVPVAGGLSFATLSASALHTCGVTTSGAAYCWGTGGIGNPIGFSVTPVPVDGGLTFATVSAGYVHTCGVTTAGAAYCWGEGYYGELGDGTANGSAPPVPVAGGLAFAVVSAGGSQSCGVTTTGSAYCWGQNTLGELGIGTSTGPEQCVNGDTLACSTIPVPVAGGLTFATVSAGGNGTCGVTTSGAPYCWGNNRFRSARY